jgi:hypothetical protein
MVERLLYFTYCTGALETGFELAALSAWTELGFIGIEVALALFASGVALLHPDSVAASSE